MELQTNERQEVISLKKQTKVLTIVLGIALILIPVGITVILNVQGIFETLKTNLGEIGRGIIIGITTLPVMIYIGLKTEGKWYKKAWAWILLVIMIGGILAVVFFMSKSTGAMPPAMPTPSVMPGV